MKIILFAVIVRNIDIITIPCNILRKLQLQFAIILCGSLSSCKVEKSSCNFRKPRF